MADKLITVQYKGIDILYVEGENEWRFTLRGRERNTESLARAKEAIDKPVPEDKKKGFTPVSAWMQKYQNPWQKVTVTSIAEKGYSSQERLWIKNANGERSKEEQYSIFADTPANGEIVAKITDFENQRKTLAAQIRKLEEKMDKFVVPTVE